jgi:hypothetical protein
MGERRLRVVPVRHLRRQLITHDIIILCKMCTQLRPYESVTRYRSLVARSYLPAGTDRSPSLPVAYVHNDYDVSVQPSMRPHDKHVNRGSAPSVAYRYIHSLRYAD